ncbi:hypothetical protein BD410DRAFT_308177 [Rickenella mellea]|uniref:Uncharacterized protein n=1 Tax=Rickenella mellea TaxID=50990 RepID=A0A4Y7Q1K0_9AGAM|nr:hypothetical protein BD410DRAFT_308177 [Rickenella mellea]
MEGLDDLLNLLTRVKKNGWEDALPDDLCQNNYQQETCHPTHSRHLPTYLQEIEVARLCMKALNEAQRRLGKRLRRLRRLSKPLVLEDGIKRLPDDILAIIFEATRHFSGDGPNQFAVCLSHVSRRFRSVALATHLLWTTIRNNYGENQTREFISRSGRLDLDIKIPRKSGIELFLKDFLEELGMTDFSQLRHVTYLWPLEVSEFSMPRLSQAEGWGWLLPANDWFLSKFTHVEFHP